eukprot:comp45507_c0_seq1/m.47542 comp45507_c0_seq1/g.47542  ORF comp45507_c0_seq1/g.47542 comp45507_c0_seq1/m.47542 type:complete len:155 (-) comp45507_c0_seq1:637-1101(-)
MFSQNSTLLAMAPDTQAHRAVLKRRSTEDFSERANKRLHEDTSSFQNSHVFVAYPSPVEQFYEPACLEMCPEPTFERPRAIARKRVNETGAVGKENVVEGPEEKTLDERSAFDYGDALQRQINKNFVGRARALHMAYKEQYQMQGEENDPMNFS